MCPFHGRGNRPFHPEWVRAFSRSGGLEIDIKRCLIAKVYICVVCVYVFVRANVCAFVCVSVM